LKKFLFPVLWGYCLFGAGCVYINSGTIFDSPDATGSHMVQATEKGDLGVLHLTAPEDLTVRANEKLLSQCPSGRLENVQDQLNERDFFWIVQSYTLRAKAICDPTKVAVVKSVLQKSPLQRLMQKKQRGAWSLHWEPSCLTRTRQQSEVMRRKVSTNWSPTFRRSLEGKL